jgi:hypothetical protein
VFTRPSVAHVLARPNNIVRRLGNSSIGDDLLQVGFPEDFGLLRCAPKAALVILASVEGLPLGATGGVIGNMKDLRVSHMGPHEQETLLHNLFPTEVSRPPPRHHELP